MKVSNCCYARVINETDVCSLCYEHCEVIDEDEAIEEVESEYTKEDEAYDKASSNAGELI